MTGDTFGEKRAWRKVFEKVPRMHIQVNGESRQVREEITVTGLLQDLQLNVERVAVEINLEILDRRDFDARMLEAGDRVEIMSFIGGGEGDF